MIDYKNVSLSNQVYETIEKNILSGVYAPGEIISESKLSQEMGVSRTPIREALAKLAGENLIADSSVGTVVLGITANDIDDMFQIKRTIEVIASGRAAEMIDEKGLKELKDLVDQQEFYAAKGNAEKVRILDTQFHDALYDNCGSSTFRSILTPIHHKLSRFRQVSLEKDDRIFRAVEEHKAVYEAIKERDKEKVEKLMLSHVERAYKGIKKGIK